MDEEKDQTQETKDQQTVDVETKEDDTSTKAAVKTSEKFDELIDTEDVEETPSGEDDESKTSKPDKSTEKTEDETGSEKKGGEDEVAGESKVSKELEKRAIDLGLTEEEVFRFESDTELERTINIIESIASEEDETKAVSQAAAQTAESKDEEGKEDFKFEFANEDNIDPELLNNIKALEKHYQDEVKSLREDVAKMKTGVKQEEQNRFIKRFDGMVENLGLEFADIFGKGSLNDLSKRSSAWKSRDKVRGRMYAFAKGLAESGENIPDEQQLFDLAISSLHGKKVKAVEGLRSSKKNATYAKGAHVGRAATKRTGSMTGHQRAVETSKKFDDLIDTTED